MLKQETEMDGGFLNLGCSFFHSTCVSATDPLRAASRVTEARTRSLRKSKNTFSLFLEATIFSRIKGWGCGRAPLVTDVHQESGRGEGTGKSEDLCIPWGSRVLAESWPAGRCENKVLSKYE